MIFYFHILNDGLNKIYAKQYGIFDVNENNYINITYNNDHWNLIFQNLENDEEYSTIIYYNLTEKLIVNSIFHNLVLNADSNDLKDVNITLDTPLILNFVLTSLYDYVVDLITVGNWDSVKSVNLYFNTYWKTVLLITDECNDKVHIVKGHPSNLPYGDLQYQKNYTKIPLFSSATLIYNSDQSSCSQLQEYCKENPDDESCSIIKGFKYLLCTKNVIIDDLLSNINDDTDGIVILILDEDEKKILILAN